MEFHSLNGEVLQQKCFQATHPNHFKQVFVYRYDDENNFVIRLIVKDSTDELYLIKTEKNLNVDETTQKIIELDN